MAGNDYRVRFSISLKYLTVSSCMSLVAASSQTMRACWCICRMLIGHIWLMLPSTAWRIAWALFSPLAIIMTSSASVMVPTPTVSAVLGTRLMSLLKKRALDFMVSMVRVLTRVREVREDPGSLNAIWPFSPMCPQ